MMTQGGGGLDAPRPSILWETAGVAGFWMIWMVPKNYS